MKKKKKKKKKKTKKRTNLQGKDDLCRVEDGLLFRESPPFSQDGEQFAAGNKVEDDVQIGVVFHVTQQINNEGDVHSAQNTLLVQYVINLGEKSSF